MKLLQAVLVGVGPFEKLVLPFADEAGEARAMTVIHGAGGVGKSSVLAALASTRPGHCVVQPTRWEPRESAPQPFAACDWALGQDEPLRPHPLSIVSPNARLSDNDEQEALRRREQVLFDRLANDGGFAFLSIPSSRSFSRQPIAFSAPARTVARYDVRAGAGADDAARSDLARETKQALAYAAISSALCCRAPVAPPADRSFELLGAAMQTALDTLLSLVGCSYRGIDPFSFEPMFSVQGSERELPFDALPTRARHLAAFGALSVRTLWAAYPDRDPRESEGVIAIDDVDLHQDAQVQQRLVRAFREALPGAQWILTTASSLVASAADARAVLALRPIPEGGGAADRDAVRVFAGDQARTHLIASHFPAGEATTPNESYGSVRVSRTRMLDDLTAGQVLGRYELLLPIAKGGMASVWAARLRGTRGFQKMVAIKTMLPGLVDDLHFERMFLDEASLASQVRHPHVIEILDLGEVDRILYLVMEWVDGEPLNIIMKYAATRGGIPLAIAVSITAQACRGLHAAHELRDENGTLVGLVHRDVSPQNVLLTYEGVVKVVDFGVAKATSRAAADTEAGQLKGKIAYMSPEQLRGERIDRRTDVFAMGILLYMMTTGTHPFRGDDQSQTIRRISDDEPVTPPSAIVPGYPAGLEAVVLQSLAKDASKRYPTANDMLIGLTRALPPSMRPSTDEEVAEFLRALLPDRLEKRKSAIKAALEAADRREAGKSAPRMAEGDSPDEAPTVLEGLVSSREVTPSAEGQQSLPGATAREALPVVRSSRSPLGRNRTRTALSAALVAALGIIVALLMSRRPGPAVAAVDSPPASPTVGVARDPAPPVDVPAVKPMEPLPPMPAESVAPAKSAAPKRWTPPIKKPDSPVAKPQSSSGTFVSPIRTPGF